jgi:hypothetical protein
MESKPGKVNPSQTELWNCENAFEFICPGTWDSLGQTESPDIRYCEVCSQNVYFCETPREFVSQGNLGRCVAIREEVTPTEAFPRHIIGRPAPRPPDYEKKRQENSKRQTDWWKGVLDLNPAFNVEEIDEIRRKFEPHK